MPEKTYVEAIRETLAEEMRRDENIIVYGLDVSLGYLSGATKGLMEEFGEGRVKDTPISEQTIVGMAVGAAIMGMRPVPEIQFSDLLTLCMDQITNQAAKLRYMSGGQISIPITIRTPGGFWGSFAAQHSQSLESWFMHVPGLKVVMPSTPADAKGLLTSAIRDDNPVLFLEHKNLYKVKGEVPEGEYAIPFGLADIKRKGRDVTIVGISLMVHRCLEAAEELKREGIDVMIIDPRTLNPLDKATIIDSVKETNRLVIVEEGCKTGGVGAEIAAIAAEEALDFLDAPIKRVAAYDCPIPFSPPLENFVIPDVNRIIQAVKETVRGRC